MGSVRWGTLCQIRLGDKTTFLLSNIAVEEMCVDLGKLYIYKTEVSDVPAVHNMSPRLYTFTHIYFIFALLLYIYF